MHPKTRATAENVNLFANVPSKFFTFLPNRENKKATTTKGEQKMIRRAIRVFSQSPDTLLLDALGMVAIFVILIAGLHFPGPA